MKRLTLYVLTVIIAFLLIPFIFTSSFSYVTYQDVDGHYSCNDSHYKNIYSSFPVFLDLKTINHPYSHVLSTAIEIPPYAQEAIPIAFHNWILLERQSPHAG